MVFGTGLMALGDERRMLLANVVATVVQYGILIVAVPLAQAWIGNGVLGAAFSRVASEFVMLVAVQIRCRAAWSPSGHGCSPCAR